MTQKNRTLEGKNRTLGGEGGGVKNHQKLSDIIYVRSLISHKLAHKYHITIGVFSCTAGPVLAIVSRGPGLLS